jgi:hypothetical protein
MEKLHELRSDNLELRKELYRLMKETHPGGTEEAQKRFCFSIHESRIQTYMDSFQEMKKPKRKKK